MVSKEIPLNYVLDSDIAEEAKIIVSTPIDTVSGDQLILVSPNYIYEGNYTTNVSSHEKTFYTFNIDMKMVRR